MKIFINGLTTGLILQIAIGPVFFFIINLTLQRTLLDGFAAVAAVTIVDYLYIILAIIGVGKLLENKKMKKILALVSSAVLIIFGILMLKSLFLTSNIANESIGDSNNFISSFMSAFFLTISSPLTIIFWTGLFTAKSIENNYSRNELFLFGLAAGLATVLFLGTAIVLISLLKTTIPISVVKILNFTVGIVLIIYGLGRLIKKGVNYE